MEPVAHRSSHLLVGIQALAIAGGVATSYLLARIVHQVIWLERYISRGQFHLVA